MQLINAMDAHGNVQPFAEETALVLESLASQAAITIQNIRYIREIHGLLRSFVHVMSCAIDARSPYNGNHSRSMAAYGEAFLDYCNALARERGEALPFPPQRREELIMSIWLHDIGKLVIPLEVMDKPLRLLPEQHSAFMHRMEVIGLLAELDTLAGRGDGQKTAQQIAEATELVNRANGVGFVTDEMLAALEQLTKRTWRDRSGKEQPWLTPEEYAMLSIRKGTLSDAERKVIQSHVEMTQKLLSQIRFSPEMSHVPEWAAAHHELLNGSGYPNRLSGDQIPAEVRILTILDIFDALTADDRPYKPGMPVKRALSVLDEMANREGKLDPDLVRLFTESRCWERAE